MKTVEIFLVFLLTNNLLFFPILGLSEALEERSRWLRLRPLLSLWLVLSVSSLLLWSLDRMFLVPWHLAFLGLPISVLVLWGFVEALRLLVPALAEQAGGREILVNTLLLGAVWFLMRDAVQWFDVLAGALAAVLGYALSLAFLNVLQSRLIREKVPAVVQGLPLQLTACGLVSLALTWVAR